MGTASEGAPVVTGDGFFIGAIRAPWDQATVQALNALQRSGTYHGYTCAEHTSQLLMAHEDGWHCPTCTYRQSWADRSSAEAGMLVVKEQWQDAVAAMLKDGLLKDVKEGK